MIAGRCGEVEGIANALRRVVVADRGPELLVIPRKGDVGGARDEAVDVAVLEVSAGDAVIAVGGDLGQVGVETKTLERAGQEAELLEVTDLPALGVSRARVGAGKDRVADEFAFKAVVRAGGNRADVEVGDDEIVELLVEPADREPRPNRTRSFSISEKR